MDQGTYNLAAGVTRGESCSWADWRKPGRCPAACAWAGSGCAAEGGAWVLVDSGPFTETYSEPDITLFPRINLGGHWSFLKWSLSFPPSLLATLCSLGY